MQHFERGAGSLLVVDVMTLHILAPFEFLQSHKTHLFPGCHFDLVIQWRVGNGGVGSSGLQRLERSVAADDTVEMVAAYAAHTGSLLYTSQSCQFSRFFKYHTAHLSIVAGWRWSCRGSWRR